MPVVAAMEARSFSEWMAIHRNGRRFSAEVLRFSVLTVRRLLMSMSG